MGDIIKEFFVDNLHVRVCRDRRALGRAAAGEVAARVRELLGHKERVGMIFAAAPSQDEFLAALAAAPGIDWPRVAAFQMDEYLDLPAGAPQSFGRYLRDHLFDRVRPGMVHFLDGNAADPDAECRRYAALLAAAPPDIVCLGIGENGHLAFNDPPADFDDPAAVRPVALEARCRMQQVHDGCFATLDQVPARALTLTIPALFAASWIYGIVPGAAKREAVARALRGAIGADCPASILRRHGRAILFLDPQSAGMEM
ncbi:MAG: glucosamine-6-phosphate deaminase [Patescibacteria group bacterium]